jgi:hypothetical protein
MDIEEGVLKKLICQLRPRDHTPDIAIEWNAVT